MRSVPVLFRVKVGPQHKSTLRTNDESAEAVTHIMTAVFRNVTPCCSENLYLEYGGNAPQDVGDCW